MSELKANHAFFRNFEDMKTIRYTTKDASNMEREEAFMALSGVERLAWFLANAGSKSSFNQSGSSVDENPNNLVLYHKDYGTSVG